MTRARIAMTVMAVLAAAPAAATPPPPPAPPPEAETPAARQAIIAADRCFTERWEVARRAEFAARDAVKAAGAVGSPSWLAARDAAVALAGARDTILRCEDGLSLPEATERDRAALSYWRTFITMNVRGQTVYETSILRALLGYRDTLAW